jgi:hypothetical protein
MLVANIHQDVEELRRRRDKSAFSQYWFSDDRGNVFGGDNPLESVFQVTGAINVTGRILQRVGAAVAIPVRDAVNLSRKRCKSGFVRMGFTG